MAGPIEPRIRRLHAHVGIGVFLAILYLAYCLGFVPRSADFADRIERFELGTEAAERAAELNGFQWFCDQPDTDPSAPREAWSSGPIDRTTPDGRWSQTPEDLRLWFRAIGPQGRCIYRRSQLTLDLVFPFAYGFLLLQLFVFACADALDRRKLARALILLPLVAVFFDLLENSATVWLSLRDLSQVWSAGFWTSVALWSTKLKWLAIGGSLLSIAVLGRRTLGDLVQRLIFVRAAVAVGALLIAFPILAASGLPVVANALITHSWSELALAVFLAVLTVVVVGHVTVIVWQLAEFRFGLRAMDLAIPIPDEDASVGHFFSSLGLGGVLILPLLVQLGIRSTAEPPAMLAGLAAGLAASLLVAWLAFLLVFQLRGHWAKAREARAETGARAGRLTRFIDCTLRRLGPGYWNDRVDPPRPEAGHLLSFVLALIVLGLYIFFYFAFDPRHANQLPSVLAFVLVILAFSCLLLSGATFLLDRWRVPLLLFLVSWAVSWNLACPRSHEFDTLAIEPEIVNSGDAKPSSNPPHDEPKPTLTVVASAGGGIQAAAWTSRVLTGLQQELEDDFTESLGLISSTSGGSVGAFYYLSAAEHQGLPGPSLAAGACVFEAASTSSLEAAAWGFLGPDFRRIVLPIGVDPSRDRGWAIERSWIRTANRMKNRIDRLDEVACEPPEGGVDSTNSRSEDVGAEDASTKTDLPDKDYPVATLEDWRRKVRDGRLPGVIFNSTFVDDGTLAHLSTVDSPRTCLEEKDSVAGTESVEPCIEERTLRAATAARLSATFPYISPITRSGEDEHFGGRHLADGGYHDNFGMVGVTRWLTESAPGEKGPRVERYGRIAFIQIVSFPYDPRQDISKNPGLQYAWLGPLKTILRVRTASQIGRNQIEVTLLKSFVESHGVRFQHTELRPTLFPGLEAPLSWHLSDANVQAIRKQWQKLVDDGALKDLEALYDEAREEPSGDGGGGGGGDGDEGKG